MTETKDLELKAEFTNSFLKTVCAFANYSDGQIVFGISDSGEIVGINDLDSTCQRIENSIADNITPIPDYEVNINSNEKTITLLVKKGANTPYLYKAKSYIRKGVSTREVDHIELLRLILAGQNDSFDAQISRQHNLFFSILEKSLQKKVGIKKLTQDILLTLRLLNSDNLYTYAAELLADKNNYPGIDMVKFGANVNIFADRATYEHCSILAQYESALNKFKQYYTYEEIVGSERIRKELIPIEAFRESIANALVHRAWDINASIEVSMYSDRIEIISPGSLPTGLSKDDFLYKQISILRNPIIADVFLKLRLIEKFGTGIFRIKESYIGSSVQPRFVIADNFVTIILPVLKVKSQDLSKSACMLLDLIGDSIISSGELVQASNLGKTQVIKLLNQLVKQGYVQRIGQGRATKYKRQLS